MKTQTQPTVKHTEGSPLREQARIIDTKAKEIVIGETWAIYVRINGCAHEITGHTKEQAEANAARIVKCVNMHDELIEVIKTTKEFFDSMPKGQFGKISCDIGLMNDMFLGINKALTLASQK